MNSRHDGRTHAERAAAGATAGDMAPGRYSVEMAQESPSETISAIGSIEETFALLVWAAAFDGVERGKHEAAAWLEVLRGYDLAAAKHAITEHYKRTRYRVMPADVVTIIEEG